MMATGNIILSLFFLGSFTGGADFGLSDLTWFDIDKTKIAEYNSNIQSKNFDSVDLPLNPEYSDTLSNTKLVKKYGLTLPINTNSSDTIPEWVQTADMFTMDLQIWKNHEFTLKDTLLSRIVRYRANYARKELIEYYPVETIGYLDSETVKGVTCLSPVPHSKEAFAEAHKKGFKVMPYVHFTDIHTNYADQDVFYFQHPEILTKDVDGKWINLPMDGTTRLYRLITCANSPAYWKLSLNYVKKMMDWGADGIFIDNVGEDRDPCFAPNFKTSNPEFGPYEHEHLFPGSSTSYAWDQMLQAIRELVKSYGNDKIVLLNSGIGTEYQKNGDINEWEGFIYNWAWEGRGHSWNEVKMKANENAWYTASGKRIAAMSYLDKKRKGIKEDAFWAFSAARLVDFIWWAEIKGTGAEILYQSHLGKPLEAIKESNGIAYRSFENGIIVLNDSDDDQTVELTLPPKFRLVKLLDIFSSLPLKPVKNNKVKVFVPLKSARVYIMKPIQN